MEYDKRYNLPHEDNINVKRYLSLLASNWYWFAGFLFISLTLAYGINRYSEKIVSVSASLLIKDEMRAGFVGMGPIFPGIDAYRNRQNLSNEIGILKSFSMNKQVIDSLPEFHVAYTMVGRRGIAESRQYKSTPFIIIPLPDNQQRPRGEFLIEMNNGTNEFELSLRGIPENSLTLNLGDTIRSVDFFPNREETYAFVVAKREDNSLVPDRTKSNRYFFYFPDPVALANQYRNKLQVSPIDENATLVILSVSGSVAEQEIDYLNKLIELYKDRGLSEKIETAKLTIEFIESQLDTIHESLIRAEDNLEKYRLQRGILDVSSEGAIVKGRLESLDAELKKAEMQEQYFKYLQEYLEGKEQTGDIISPALLNINDPVLFSLVSDLSVLQNQKMQLSHNIVTGHEVVRLLDEKIEKTRRALMENIANNLRNIRNSSDELKRRLIVAEAELNRLPETEKELIRIQRVYDLNNTVYIYLLEKKAEAEIASASTVPDNKEVDWAGPHNVVTVSPRTSRNNFMAIVLGFSIPVLLIFAIDYLNNKVIDKRDVERATTVPILGYISHNNYKTETPVIQRPGSTLSESFRSVRTALKFYTDGIKSPVIAISSTVSAEGKTFISVNLAVIMAMLNKKVLIIGLDLRKPKIHKLLDIDNVSGMSNYLSGAIDYSEVAQKTSVENLWYAPSGPIPPNPAELIESERMGQFLEEARKHYDYIIVDTPPVAIVTDALLLSSFVDVNIFVVRQRYSSKNTLDMIQDFYEQRKLKNLSIILNDISLTGYYGYGLRYGYSVRYGGYTYGYNFYGDYVTSRYGYGKEQHGYYSDNDN